MAVRERPARAALADHLRFSDGWHAKTVPGALSNSLTLLTASFVEGLSDGTSIKSGLVQNFGPFLQLVPKYLGRNESLDAASEALVACWSSYRTTKRAAPDTASLRKYSKALEKLRNCLASEQKACETETLCAIMMIMTTEVSAYPYYAYA